MALCVYGRVTFKEQDRVFLVTLIRNHLPTGVMGSIPGPGRSHMLKTN